MAITDIGVLNEATTRHGSIDDVTITYDVDEEGWIGGTGGLACSMSGDNEYQRTSDAEGVAGKLLGVSDDDKCVLIVGGVVTFVAGVGGCTAGSKIVGAVTAGAAKGYVRDMAPAVLAEVAVGRHMALNTAIAGATVYVQLDGGE